MKTLFSFIFLICAALGAPTIPLPTDPSYIFSTATRVENGFLYEYNMRRDLWRYDFTYFELWDVVNPNIWNPQSNLDFNLRLEESSIIFDGFNIGDQPNTVLFSFFSLNSPELGSGKIAFDPSFAQDLGRVLVPSGEIVPEPNIVVILSVSGLLFLALRRRSVK